MEQLIENKKTVIRFYKELIGDGNVDIINEIIADPYIQHNPEIKDGKEGLLEVINFLRQIPKSDDAVKPTMRIIAEGDFVVLHMAITFAGESKIVIDIFRFENGLIKEHWDAIMKANDNPINGNTETDGPYLINNEAAVSQNKMLIHRFCNEVLIDNNFAHINHFMAEDLQQHHAKILHGLKAWCKYQEDKKMISIHNIIAEGDFVATQASGFLSGIKYVFYDIYRIESHKICEHWPVYQPVPATMIHDNGMI